MSYKESLLFVDKRRTGGVKFRSVEENEMKNNDSSSSMNFYELSKTASIYLIRPLQLKELMRTLRNVT